jgi:putative phage-type endonuclease
MKFKVDNNNLKNIIHTVFTENDLSNSDIECDETYNSIVDMIYEMYTSMYDTTQHNEDSLQFLENINSFKTECLQIYTRIHELVEERLEVSESTYTAKDIEKISTQLNYLDNIPLPKQRTPEWYTFRSNRLTASDLGTVLELNPYSSIKELILKKCGHEKKFIAGAAITHGVKFEDVAIRIYSDRNNVDIKEYGCIPHPSIEHFGASPDGICSNNSDNKNYVGRMLEIKCPKSRELNGYVPEYYAAQVQGQLEVCDLEYCDFLECVIREYESRDQFLKDTKGGKSRGNLNYRKNCMEKGVLIEYYNLITKNYQYMYCPIEITKSLKLLENWEEENINKILEEDSLEYVGTTFWKLEQYSVIFVKRDKEWFKMAKKQIDTFWSDVIKYRRDGVETLLPKKRKAKQKKSTSATGFLYDSD